MPPGPIANSTRATRFSVVAVSLAALSITALAFTIYGISHTRNLSGPSLADVSTEAIWTTLVCTPISLLLSILAMKARARCLNPRPRMPLVALSVSMPLAIGVVLLAVLLFILAAFDHPGS